MKQHFSYSRAVKIIFIVVFFFNAAHAHVSGLSLKWLRGIGNANLNEANYQVDSHGNIYLYGVLTDSMDFDPSTFATFYLTPAANVKTFFYAKYDSLGYFLWAKKLVCKSFVNPQFRIQLDKYDHIYLMGEYRDSTDFDPSPATSYLTTFNHSFYTDLFLAKYDSGGNFLWAKSIHTNKNFQRDNYFFLDNRFDQIYITGAYSNPADFDPGPAISTPVGFVYSSGDFVAKYDLNGNFQWVKFIGGTTVQINDIKIDNQQNVLLSCQTDFEVYFYFDSVNYTLIPAIATYTTMGGANVWEGSNTFYVKIGANGSAKWVNYIEHPDPNWPQRIVIDNQDNITVETFCGSNFDLTATNGTFNLNANGITNFIKFDSLGNFISIRGALYHPDGIDTDKNGYIYCSGTLTNPIDFDLGPGNNVLNTPYPVPYLAKYDSDLNLQWAGKMGKGTSFGHYDFSDSSKIYFAGSYSSSFNAEPNLDTNYALTSHGSSDIFFAQYELDTCGNFFLAIDSVQNILCSTLSGSVFSHAGNGVPPYTYTWNTTPASFSSHMNTGVTGDFTGTVLDSLGCSASAFVRVEGSPHLNDIDLGVNSGGGSFRTGMQSNLWLNVYNDGCVPSGGTLKLILDTAVVFNSSVPLPTSQSGDTLTWIFLPLDYNSAHFMPVVSLTPSNTLLGSFLNFNAFVEPLIGDVDTSNNHRRCRFPLFNSLDPNAKSVFPAGDGILGKIGSNQTMTYTVHFQNTGNANALNISILDSIDADLDIYSLRVVASSQPLTYISLIGNNAVRFYFNNINLPDSATDPIGSNGYVIYEIKQKANLPHLTQITNTAHIYFDFNPAIITNTVLNTVDLSTSVLEKKELENAVTIYPNPVTKSMSILLDKLDENSKVLIYDAQGKQIKLPFAISKNQIIVDTKDLQQGIYNAVITFPKTGESRSCKFIRM